MKAHDSYGAKGVLVGTVVEDGELEDQPFFDLDRVSSSVVHFGKPDVLRALTKLPHRYFPLFFSLSEVRAVRLGSGDFGW